MAAKTIGLFGGTFDPIHLGHISLALDIQEKKGLDEVWFCPAWINPLKLDSDLAAPPEHRLAMLELALAGIPGFHILDIELKRQGPSYTIDTLKTLLEKDNANHYALIIGEDSVHDFFKWRQAEEIAALVPIYVGSRASQAAPQDIKGSPALGKALMEGWTPTRILEISATEIRQRLRQGLYCGHLMPKEKSRLHL